MCACVCVSANNFQLILKNRIIKVKLEAFGNSSWGIDSKWDVGEGESAGGRGGIFRDWKMGGKGKKKS